jgi:glycosyltransferase involved in cell wall biosynthesis
MNYPPNIDVVKYITKHLLPEFPDATLLVSGAEPHNSIVNLANSNSQVTLTGWVDDIRASYADAKIFLAPMMIGTGMQNKLLEAMAMQTPCITTDLANNAIKAEHNVHILVGNTKEELIEAMKLLLEDHALREKIAKEGQIYVKTNYNWEKSTEKLRGFLEH